jgi:hypothetical protein
VASLLPAGATAQTLDEIVAKHIAARGSAARIEAIQSLRMTGKARASGGREALVVREIKLPGRIRTEFTVQGLTGVYAMADNPTFTMTIDLKGAGLTAFVPGQPIYDLVPYRGTEFRLKQVTGFAVRFILDEKGAVTEALLLQPDAVYTIRRK